MKAIQLTTPVNVGDLDEGTNQYTHVRPSKIDWLLDANEMVIYLQHGYIDTDGDWVSGGATGSRRYELIGDDYAAVAVASVGAVGEPYGSGIVGAILQVLVDATIYDGSVIDF